MLPPFLYQKLLEVKKMEIWKDIPNYEGRYQASTTGKIRSIEFHGKKKIHELKSCNNGTGYLVVILSKNNNKKMWLVHRLVALTFLDKPQECDFVNHKDENKHNNSVDNLEWCTKSYNAIYYLNYDENRKKEYAKRLGKTSPMIQHIPKKHFQKVIQSTKDGVIVKEWNNATEASLATNILIGNLLGACKKNAKVDKKRKHKATAKGFVWEFK